MENASSQPGFDCWGGVVWLSLADCAFYPHLKLFNIEPGCGKESYHSPFWRGYTSSSVCLLHYYLNTSVFSCDPPQGLPP